MKIYICEDIEIERDKIQQIVENIVLMEDLDMADEDSHFVSVMGVHMIPVFPEDFLHRFCIQAFNDIGHLLTWSCAASPKTPMSSWTK